MDSSGLRLIIGILFGTFLLIMVISELAKRRPKELKIKPKKETGFQRPMTPVEMDPNSGFRRTPEVPTTPTRPQNNFKIPRS